jgi:hypothetical protein
MGQIRQLMLYWCYTQEKNNWENVANANIRKMRGAEYEKLEEAL